MSLNTLDPPAIDLPQVSALWRGVRALVPGVRPQRFLVLASPRAGSRVLAKLLSAQLELRCDSDALTRKRRALPRYLETQSLRAQRSCYGVTMTQAQLAAQGAFDPRRFVGRMHARGWKIIYLERENLVRQALSFVVVNHRKAWGHPDPWTHRQGDGPLVLGRIHVDPCALLARLEAGEHERQGARALLADVPHLTLAYERDLSSADARRAAADKVAAFLGVDPAPRPSDPQADAARSSALVDTLKIVPDDLAALIANYAELAEALADTPYASMLRAA